MYHFLKDELFNGKQALEGKQLRLIKALPQLSLEASEEYDVLIQWLKESADNQKHIADKLLDMPITLTSDLRRITVYLAGPASSYRQEVSLFIKGIGACKKEISDFTEACYRIGPARTGTWLELSRHGMDGGWYITGNLASHELLQYITPSADSTSLLNWMQEFDITECFQFSCSVADVHPVKELYVKLYDNQIDKSISAIKNLFLKLDLLWFGPALENTLKELGASKIGLMTALTEEGICQLGILVFDPAEELILTLANLCGNFSYKKLAAFEAMLLSDAPEFIIFSQSIGSLELTLCGL